MFEELGLQDEIGYEKGGFWTPDELLETLESISVSEDVKGLWKHLAKNIETEGRAHELIHCLDVAFGSHDLTHQFLSDSKAKEQVLAGSETDYKPFDAFFSGIYHDISLAFKRYKISSIISTRILTQLLDHQEQPKVIDELWQVRPQYNKDPIGDDLRGYRFLKESAAFMIDPLGGMLNPKFIKACYELLKGSDLRLNQESQEFLENDLTLLGRFSPYKILDAVWYHDGNFPIRGFAEADAIVGDRLALFEQGRVNSDVVLAGIDKLLGYTESDPQWEERSRNPDVEYLRKKVAKKAGPFMEAVEGTETFDYLVEELASQGRGFRTINSPAFWRGVDLGPGVLKRALENPQLRNLVQPQIEELQKRYEAVEQYKPGDLK
ncbi:MAG: hypothetical protein V1740_03180 [Candidatus Woesearchaeota archaeon]